MTLRDLLAARGVRRALIVDDACDETPLAADLAGKEGDWATFAADLAPEHREMLEREAPETVGMSFDEQMTDDRYVAAVWRLRDQLDGLADSVFEAYDAQRASDMEYVRLARERLEALGLETAECGRNFEDRAKDVELILIDLYFGGAQNEEAFNESRRRLTKAVQQRRDNPPLVLLMSRSERIYDRRDAFRDEVGLVDSGFRILLKPDLRIADRLDRQLERLADNRPDTLKLARFLNALENGVAEAAHRTLSVMRRLKLSDVGQIQQLLLDVEGEPVGSYLVDIFDRVLQHEIERDSDIIDAAIAVNDLTSARHPPPFVAGSPQLQQVVERTLSQNRQRLRLPGSAGSAVGFGDVLRSSAVAGGDGARLYDLKEDDVLVVLTPACDLQRGLVPRVMLISGKLGSIERLQWSYAQDARTPAIDIGGELRWIKWNVKHVLTLSWAELEQALASGALEVVARLREAHALEIQQKMLAGLGRVGLVAPMPATFSVSIEAYVLDEAGAPQSLEVPHLNDEAVVWVGRDKDGKPVRRLVATEPFCDGLDEALAPIDTARIHASARPALNYVRGSGELRRRLSGGLDITAIKQDGWLKVPTENGGQQVPDMALVVLNGLPEVERRLQAKGGVLLVIREVHRQVGVPSLDDFVDPVGAQDDEMEQGE